MATDDLPDDLTAALEFAEDSATAHCIRTRRCGVLIFRDEAGGEFRRLVGPQGSTEIPPGFDDAVILGRLAAQVRATDEAKLAMDAVIAQAQADGDRVVII